MSYSAQPPPSGFKDTSKLRGAGSTSRFSGCAKRTSLKRFRKAIKDELKEWEYCDSKAGIIAFLGCVNDRVNGGLGDFTHNAQGEAEETKEV